MRKRGGGEEIVNYLPSLTKSSLSPSFKEVARLVIFPGLTINYSI